MSINKHRTKRTREDKIKANHDFLISWQPSGLGVKGELNQTEIRIGHKLSKAKNADILAQDSKTRLIKKDIFKSLILISLILILELVIYLAQNRFMFLK